MDHTPGYWRRFRRRYVKISLWCGAITAAAGVIGSLEIYNQRGITFDDPHALPGLALDGVVGFVSGFMLWGAIVALLVALVPSKKSARMVEAEPSSDEAQAPATDELPTEPTDSVPGLADERQQGRPAAGNSRKRSVRRRVVTWTLVGMAAISVPAGFAVSDYSAHSPWHVPLTFEPHRPGPSWHEMHPGWPEQDCSRLDPAGPAKESRSKSVESYSYELTGFHIAENEYNDATGTSWTPNTPRTAASADVWDSYLETWAAVANQPNCFTQEDVDKAQRILAGAPR